MTITVFSLDFDGSLHHEGCDDSSLDQLIEKNAFLKKYIQRIVEKNALVGSVVPNKPIFLIGSNRQSYGIESGCILSKGHRCFESMEALAKNFGGKLDDFLLEDVFNDKEPGFSYKRACKLLTSLFATSATPIETLNPCPPDTNKILLVFAQIQKIANEYSALAPEETIDYHFADDREDILQALSYFYQNHPFMIPSNVKLNLTHYAKGEAPKPYNAPIHGRGPLQPNYNNLVKEMSIGLQNININQSEEGDIQITPKIRTTSVSTSQFFVKMPIRVRKEAALGKEEIATTETAVI